MDTVLFLLIGFALGFLFIFLIRLGQGTTVNCSKCGQKHWLGPKNTSPVCKKCGTPLKVVKKAGGAAKAGAGKKKRG